MEKILIFSSTQSADYWFKYTCRFLKEQNCLFKAYFYERKIIYHNVILLFVANVTERFFYGRGKSRIYFKMENRMEKEYIKTLKEIFEDGEETKGE